MIMVLTYTNVNLCLTYIQISQINIQTIIFQYSKFFATALIKCNNIMVLLKPINHISSRCKSQRASGLPFYLNKLLKYIVVNYMYKMFRKITCTYFLNHDYFHSSNYFRSSPSEFNPGFTTDTQYYLNWKQQNA